MHTLKSLRDSRAAVIADGKAVVNTYTAADRDPTDEEMERVNDLAAQREQLDEQIAALEKRADLERSFDVVDSAQFTGGTERAEDDPARGFNDLAQFISVVMHSSRKNATVDKRLLIGAAPTTYTGEGVGADGGFLVPPGFAAGILEDAMDDQSLLPLIDETPVSGNGMEFPADESTPWGTSGVQAYWEAEAAQATQSKLALKSKSLRLAKLFALVPITEEQMADAASTGAYVARRVPKAIRWKTDDAILNGDGVGKPLGIIGHGGTVDVTKETSQTAATIVIENLVKAYSRCINPARGTWVANISAFPQLYYMKDNAGNNVYRTVDPGLGAGMSGLLLGRPLVFNEAAQTLGTSGDLVFGDFEQYKAITKAGGLQVATSMHLWFDYDVQAFRTTFRIDGQPWRGSTLSPGKGSVTRGNFVTIATRA